MVVHPTKPPVDGIPAYLVLLASESVGFCNAVWLQTCECRVYLLVLIAFGGWVQWMFRAAKCWLFLSSIVLTSDPIFFKAVLSMETHIQANLLAVEVNGS